MGAIFAVAANNINGGLIDFFHGVQVAIMLALMSNILQFAWCVVSAGGGGLGAGCRAAARTYLATAGRSVCGMEAVG